jgi:hypothetical protein
MSLLYICMPIKHSFLLDQCTSALQNGLPVIAKVHRLAGPE